MGITYLCATLSGLQAGEHVVQAEKFEKTVALEGVLLPEGASTFRIEPEAWESFAVLEAVPQGAAVKQGEAVVVIETKDLDRKIVEEGEAGKLRALALAAAQRELADLEVQTPRALEATRRAFQRAKEDLVYFNATGRPVKQDAAEKAVERAERQLEYQREELTQLLKMYEEDDLTEETEEIILKRQRNSVTDTAQFLERAKITLAKITTTDLPREQQDLEVKRTDAELALGTKKEALPRALRKKRLDVKTMAEGHQKAEEKLVELRQDRALMEIKAPAAGRVYYGEFADGRWNPGQTAKFLKRGGSLPGRSNFATLVPDGAELRVHAAVKEEALRALRVGQEGYFASKTSSRERMAGKVLSVSRHPNLAGGYPLVFQLKKPVGDLVAGMQGTIRLVSDAQDAVLTVPVGALTEKSDGTLTVSVKTADAQEERQVEVGAEADGKIVIVSGLEAGEVVVIPEAEGKK